MSRAYDWWGNFRGWVRYRPTGKWQLLCEAKSWWQCYDRLDELRQGQGLPLVILAGHDPNRPRPLKRRAARERSRA